MLPNLKSAALGLFFMGLSVAHAGTPDCPLADRIIEAGLSQSDVLEGQAYIAYHVDTYGTPWEWIFALAPLKASSDEDALKQGNALLPNLTGNPIPEGGAGGVWTCEYHPINSSLYAMAMTVPVGLNLAQFKQKFSR